ncbi:MAG: alpha/beta fold hydrolase [Gemmatimonadaceae bacterium]
MTRLHPDQTFHFEILRALGVARYGGSDAAEVLAIIDKLEAGNFESWYRAWVTLAERVEASISATSQPVSVRDAMFRAATYYRAADFFLHGDPDDPRIDALWAKQRACFDRAISLLPIPGERVTLRADGFSIPCIFYRASLEAAPRPTVIICSGFDGSQEELMHTCGFAALERGYNVLTYEGPGQPTVRREQNVGFIYDWERALKPVVDYAVTRPEVDAKQLASIGISMGGYLAARAAAFEPRLAATILIDGVAEMFSNFSFGMPREMVAMLDSEASRDKFDALVAKMTAPTDMKLRWARDQASWSFNSKSAWQLMNVARKMTVADLGGKIRHPVLVCDAARDHFFGDQPARVMEILGATATHYVFADDELGASEHCHVGASIEMNHRVFDWLAGVFGAAHREPTRR